MLAMIEAVEPDLPSDKPRYLMGESYAVLPHNTIEILFGKWSGASNFRYLFEKELNHPQPKEQYEKMRSVIKTLAVEQERYFTAEEVVELWKNGIFE
ncbi:hypothetical protein [Planktothrix agardhii]|uniref:hypothetical protein n=1 Tax=Planktothrix agardhii TaxID=1160 RepID=UPI002E309C77|nr:hypothetical protein [Planktothrix agardhii]